MGEFWSNELNLFKEDMNNFKEFWAQPITFGGDKNLMLKPTIDEVEVKAQEEMNAETNGFWQKEWKSFMSDLNGMKEFWTQPVTFK
ncbi:MAG: hypothetical protein RSE00_05415 [Clostridia bacterium]